MASSARPGLKSPPRHAVVVRGGDRASNRAHPAVCARASHRHHRRPSPSRRPRARRITLRAIPTPVSSKAAALPARSAPPVVDSLPPPSNAPLSKAPLSDAPFVSSVSETFAGPESQRSGRSRWTVVAAAAAGLVLGLASVAARVYAPGAAAQPPRAVTLSAPPVAAPSLVAKPAPECSSRQHRAPPPFGHAGERPFVERAQGAAPGPAERETQHFLAATARLGDRCSRTRRPACPPDRL